MRLLASSTMSWKRRSSSFGVSSGMCGCTPSSAGIRKEYGRKTCQPRAHSGRTPSTFALGTRAATSAELFSPAFLADSFGGILPGDAIEREHQRPLVVGRLDFVADLDQQSPG